MMMENQPKSENKEQYCCGTYPIQSDNGAVICPTCANILYYVFSEQVPKYSGEPVLLIDKNYGKKYHFSNLVDKVKDLTSNQKRQIKDMYSFIFTPYYMYCGKRKNLFNSNYIIKKLAEQLDVDLNIKLPSKKTIEKNNIIWNKICDYNGWKINT